MSDNDWSYEAAQRVAASRNGGAAVATENTSTEQQGTATGMGPMVAQIAEMVRVYYEGLGSMPEPLKEQLTKDFAAEINRAMGNRIAKGSDAGSA